MLQDCPAATKLSQVVPSGLSADVWAWYVQERLFTGQLREQVVIMELKIIYDNISKHTADGKLLARAITQDYIHVKKEAEGLTGQPVVHNFQRQGSNEPPVLIPKRERRQSKRQKDTEYGFYSVSSPY